MSSLSLTDHALTRMAQRGFSLEDVDLILALGTEVPDGFVMREKDCSLAISQLKQIIHKIEHLGCKRLVVREGVVVTLFTATPSQMKPLLTDKERRKKSSLKSKRYSDSMKRNGNML